MKREAYDLVTKWKKKYPDKTMAEAFKACRVNAATYYGQRSKIGPSKRASSKALATYEAAELLPVEVQQRAYGGPGELRPGMVALIGSPEDMARMVQALGGVRNA